VFAVADGEWLRHPVGVQRRVVAAWLAVVALGGCFYTAPINRQPKVLPLTRRCDAAHPADPCTPENLHHGDHVMVEARFSDPDGDPDDGTVQWRISACDGPALLDCDENRLYDPMKEIPTRGPFPEFTVPSVLTGTRTVAQTIVFEITVRDDRGASSSAEVFWDVIPDPP
jgi:hypothetical protein